MPHTPRRRPATPPQPTLPEPQGIPSPNLYDHPHAPLAAPMRPPTPADYIGPEHPVRPGKNLRRIVAESKARKADYASGPLAHPREGSHVPQAHPERVQSIANRTILFIDEIHRFNKAQQDAVLPYVEDGTVTLIGATTENPSFEVVAPLLSRARVFKLELLAPEELRTILRNALNDQERGLGRERID